MASPGVYYWLNKNKYMKILCKLFGHPDRPHYHRPTDVVSCNGRCERHIEPYEILPCPRCGSTGFTGLVSNSEVEEEIARIDKEYKTHKSVSSRGDYS